MYLSIYLLSCRTCHFLPSTGSDYHQ